MKNNGINSRIIHLIIASLILLSAGIIYTWSVIKVPLKLEFNWTTSQLAANYTLTLCFFCLGGMLGSRLTKHISPTKALWISALLIAVGFFLTSKMHGSIILLFFSYACLGGLGVGISYNVVISTTNLWFPDKKGMCSGIMTMCFGLSSFLIGKIADRMFSIELIGWRGALLYIGEAIALIVFCLSFGIKKPSSEFLSKIDVTITAKKVSSCMEIDTRTMIKRRSFILFYIYSSLTVAVGSSVIGFAKDLALTVGAQAALATSLVGILAICNGCGRVLCGFIFDSLGRYKTMVFAGAVTIVSTLVILISLIGNSIIMNSVGLCLTGISYGFSATISSSFVSECYGLKNFQSNYSVANTLLIPGSFGSVIAGALLTSSGGFIVPILLLFIFAVLALVSGLFINEA